MDLHRYHYAPHLGHKALSLLLLPLSYLYGAIATLKRLAPRLIYGKQGRDFGLPIISVGNLIAGGSGKTPFIIALATHLASHYLRQAIMDSGAESTLDSKANTPGGHIIIISRGYKRKSKGLLWVSRHGTLLTTASLSGDEPYLIATALSQHNVSVIVSENRARAIRESKRYGADVVLLDDGLRFCFSKFDIILRPNPEPFYQRLIPSGIYRESPALYAKLNHSPYAIIAQDGRDFMREVWVKNPSPKMFLLSAIANPTRLLAFLPPIYPESSTQSPAPLEPKLDSSAQAMDNDCRIVGSRFFPDHHHFSPKEIHAILESYAPTSLLTTAKDATKLQEFQELLSVMELRLHIHSRVLCATRHYLDLCLDSSVRAGRESMVDSAPKSIGDFLYRLIYAKSFQPHTHEAYMLKQAKFARKPSWRDPIQTLRDIERSMLASIAAPEFGAKHAGQGANKGILLLWLWLPCDMQSLRNGLLQEALAILENAFYEGVIDFWLDRRFYTKSQEQDFSQSATHSHLQSQSLSQSLPQKHGAWKYLYDALVGDIFLEAGLSGKTPPESNRPSTHAWRKISATTLEYLAFGVSQADSGGADSGKTDFGGLDSKAPKQNLSWDSPELFCLANVRVGLTKSGQAYYARLLDF